ncbi:unnamed protein product [Orchesella dallaii]|uniref:Uncharacterized protein n=1 Tax=Orchesella dallaii TaxID=48710 RepID=A0ABP1QMM6_9HEXA
MSTIREKRKSRSGAGGSMPSRSSTRRGKHKILSIQSFGIYKPLPIIQDPPAHVVAHLTPYAQYADLGSEERLIRPYVKWMVPEEQKESHLLLALAAKKLIPVQHFETISDSEYNKLYPPVFKNDLRDFCPNKKPERPQVTNSRNKSTGQVSASEPRVVLERVDAKKFQRKSSPMLVHHRITKKLLAVLRKSKTVNKRTLRSDTSGSRTIIMKDLALINKSLPHKRVLRSELNKGIKRRQYH